MNIAKEIGYIIMVVLVLPCCAYAQPNVKIAYNLGYMEANSNNQTLSDFNEAAANSLFMLDNPMKNLHIVSGIEIGVRFKNDLGFAYELSYENLTSDKDAVGETMDGEVFSKELFYGFKALHLGLEWTDKRYGIGATIGRRTNSIKENSITGEKRSILKTTNYVSKVFFIFDIGGTDNLSFQLRPYATIPYSKVSLDPLRTNLELGNSSGTNEGFMTYGITIAFYNGPQ